MKSKLILCLALVLSGGLLWLLFGPPSLPKPTHQEINLSNGGTIYIDSTFLVPQGMDSSDVDSKISYKPPGNGAIEPITVDELYSPLDKSEIYPNVVGPLVVVITGGMPFVRSKDGVWKNFAMGFDFPSTDDFSPDDIKLMGITSQRSQGSKAFTHGPDEFTTIENFDHFDPQTRVLLINYFLDGKIEKRLKLQLSEDGTKLKVLDVREGKNPTP
jgi:hypothetical protein